MITFRACLKYDPNVIIIAYWVFTDATHAARFVNAHDPGSRTGHFRTGKQPAMSWHFRS